MSTITCRRCNGFIRTNYKDGLCDDCFDKLRSENLEYELKNYDKYKKFYNLLKDKITCGCDTCDIGNINIYNGKVNCPIFGTLEIVNGLVVTSKQYLDIFENEIER